MTSAKEKKEKRGEEREREVAEALSCVVAVVHYGFFGAVCVCVCGRERKEAQFKKVGEKSSSNQQEEEIVKVWRRLQKTIRPT